MAIGVEDRLNQKVKELEARYLQAKAREAVREQSKHIQDEIIALNNTLTLLNGAVAGFEYNRTAYNDAFARKCAIQEAIDDLKRKRSTLGIFAVRKKKAIDVEIVAKEVMLSEITKTAEGYKADTMGCSSLTELHDKIRETELLIEKNRQLLNSGEGETTVAVIAEINRDAEIKERLSRLLYKKGDIIQFGNYHGSTEWLVLDRQGDRLLMISKDALDCRLYNSTYTVVTWETCSLRRWLNEAFLNEAFSAEERAVILDTTVTPDQNTDYETVAGRATTDKVFLLSITEAERYFPSDDARQCKPTAYAKAQGAYTNGSGNCWWWLRSPGSYQTSAAYVYNDGAVSYGGDFVINVSDCVRPALWISIE